MKYRQKLQLIENIVDIWLQVCLRDDISIKVQAIPHCKDWFEVHVNAPLTIILSESII